MGFSFLPGLSFPEQCVLIIIASLATIYNATAQDYVDKKGKKAHRSGPGCLFDKVSPTPGAWVIKPIQQHDERFLHRDR